MIGVKSVNIKCAFSGHVTSRESRSYSTSPSWSGYLVLRIGTSRWGMWIKRHSDLFGWTDDIREGRGEILWFTDHATVARTRAAYHRRLRWPDTIIWGRCSGGFCNHCTWWKWLRLCFWFLFDVYGLDLILIGC